MTPRSTCWLLLESTASRLRSRGSPSPWIPRRPCRRRATAICACSGASGRSTRGASTTTVPTAATPLSAVRSSLGPELVIREVKDSKLLGRGGAAFPMGVKWEAVARQPAQPHYLICNADESEPGTFKDRVLIEGDPYALIEAMTIAAFATNCPLGFVYLRGEYPQAHAILGEALAEARRRGYLGRTSSATDSRSTSRSARERARTSAARRPRSSTRSRASAASPATSLRSLSSKVSLRSPR